MKTLVITYGIQRLGGGVYGLPAWTHFWTLVKPTDLAVGSHLFCGDILPTAHDYAIAIQSPTETDLSALEARFRSDKSYDAIAGSGGVVQSYSQPTELLLAGVISNAGTYENLESQWALPALEKVVNQNTLSQNKIAYATPHQISINRVHNETGVQIADRRFQDASAMLSADADGQLVIEISLKGPEPELDFEEMMKMKDEELNRYFSTQKILVDQNYFYTIEYVDGSTQYMVKAACLQNSGNTYHFHVPCGTLPERKHT